MKTAIIFNPYGLWDFHANFEVPIYHNLIARGYKVIYLRCGVESQDCDLHQANVIGMRPLNACDNCRKHTDAHLRSMGIEYQSVSDYLDPQDASEIRKMIFGMDSERLKSLNLFGINIYDLSIGSVHTHFRVNEIDLNNEVHLRTLRNYIVNAALMIVAGKIIFNEDKPDFALIFNGRMAVTRAMVEMCKTHGVRFATHERGLNRGYFLVNIDDKCTSHINAKFISDYNLRHPLKRHEVKLVKKWFNDRIGGTNINWKNFLEASKVDGVLQKSCHKRWVLFTSSTDEFVSEPDFQSPLGSQYDWILKTCEIASKNNVELIIRVHPNSYGPTSTGKNLDEKKFFDSLAARTDYLNLKIIDSNKNVNSYELAKTADLVLVFASTIAIESLLLGKRTYVAANSDWIHCPSILSYLNVPEYDVFLNEEAAHGENSDLTESDLVVTYRFLYNYLFKCFINFPFIEQLSQSHNQIHAHTVQDFDVGNYIELDHVVESMLGLKNLISRNTGYFSDEECIIEKDAIFQLNNSSEKIDFSVIITNYNYGIYLRNCVESVIDQDINGVEIIIVDDGSTDDSRVIIDQLLLDFPDHKIITVFQENSGQPAIPRNKGIAMAHGEFILPLDADDVIARGYLKGCLEIIKKRPEVNLIYADSIHVHADKNVRHPPGVFAPGRINKANQIVIASVYSKLLWEKTGGYKENVRGYEDWDLWLNMSIHGAIPAYFKGVGLIYNAKDSGLFGDAKSKHENLYSQLILNNISAYNHDRQLFRWARDFQLVNN
jgi:hypothetical protein